MQEKAMELFNTEKIREQLTEKKRFLDIGDAMSIEFKDFFGEVYVDGIRKEKLKSFKLCYSIYDNYNHGADSELIDPKLPTEVMVIEEYSDSCDSIYISNDEGIVSSSYGDDDPLEFAELLIDNLLLLKVDEKKEITFEVADYYEIAAWSDGDWCDYDDVENFVREFGKSDDYTIASVPYFDSPTTEQVKKASEGEFNDD